MAGKSDSVEIQVLEMQQGRFTACILGTSPFICNRMSEKARMELLMPKGKKNAAEKASSMKHDVMKEYRDSPYLSIVPTSKTLLQVPSAMFKGAMKVAAKDIPGTSMAQIGRLTYVEGDRIDLFGMPQLLMSVTRSSDIKRTPDVRTRAILPRWACYISVNFAKPVLREQSVLNLLAAGGITAGIGDWRIEKGSGSYGGYRVCEQDDPEFQSIIKESRAAQEGALAEPVCYDDETEKLLAWYLPEVNRRGFKVVSK